MKIKCTSCGYREEVNTRLFIRIIGGVMPFGGYWAWVTYFLLVQVLPCQLLSPS